MTAEAVQVIEVTSTKLEDDEENCEVVSTKILLRVGPPGVVVTHCGAVARPFTSKTWDAAPIAKG